MDLYFQNSTILIKEIDTKQIKLYCMKCDIEFTLVNRTIRDYIRLGHNPNDSCSNCKRCNQLNEKISIYNPPINVLKTDKDNAVVECNNCKMTQTFHIVAFWTKMKKHIKSKSFDDWCTSCVKKTQHQGKMSKFAEEMYKKHGHIVTFHDPVSRDVKYICGNCSAERKSNETSIKNGTGYCVECQNDKNRNSFENICNIVAKAGHKIAMTKDEYKSNKEIYFYCSCGNPEKETTSLHRLSNGSSCIKCSKSRALNTIKEQYGCTDETVTNIMHLPEIFYKAIYNAYKLKDYKLPSGRIIKIQGYEHRAIDLLLSNDFICPFVNDKIVEDMISVGNEIKPLDYVFENCIHKYYPDIYIKNTKVYIEVKSVYTFVKEFDKNMAKFLSFVDKDEQLIVLIFDEKELVITMYF